MVRFGTNIYVVESRLEEVVFQAHQAAELLGIS